MLNGEYFTKINPKENRTSMAVELYKEICKKIESTASIDMFSKKGCQEFFEAIDGWTCLDNIKASAEENYTVEQIEQSFELAEKRFGLCDHFNEINDILKCCDKCLEQFLYLSKKPEMIKDIENGFLIRRILFNCLLIKLCLYPHLKKQENEVRLSDKLANELNICIIIAQTDYFKNIFARMMRSISRQFYGMEGCNVKTLYLLGLLNFRKNSYKEALYFLDKACKYYKRNKETAVFDHYYFQTRILLAYCYEYMHEFETAIKELMGIEISSFIKESKEISVVFDVFSGEDFAKRIEKTRDFYKDFEEKIIKDETKHEGIFYDAILRDRAKDDLYGYGDRHEILHSFAHCCNEYALKFKKSQDEDESQNTEMVNQLLLIARNTMLFVANANKYDWGQYADFSSCLFMIFAEANDFEVCERQIDNIMGATVLDDQDDDYCASISAVRKKYNEKGDFWAEVNFYKYLVSYFSFKSIGGEKIGIIKDIKQYNEVVKQSYENYLNYAKKRYDYDAEAYIKIFEYKFQIAKSLKYAQDDNQLIQSITSAIDIAKNLRRPSPFVNEWIQSEYERIVLAGELLSRYIFGSPINELFALATRCKKLYDYTGKEELFASNEKYYLPELESADNGKVYNYYQSGTNAKFCIAYERASVLGHKIECKTKEEAERLYFVFKTIDTVIDDFVSPSSIFILAPLSAAAPYQYQTGNVKELVTSIFATNDTDNNEQKKYAQTAFLSRIKNTGSYNNEIISKLEGFGETFKKISYGSFEDTKHYYYKDKGWENPIKRQLFNAYETTYLLEAFLREDKNIINSTRQLRHYEVKGCDSEGHCCTALYKYGKDKDNLDIKVNDILNNLFISREDIQKGDYILLKRTQRDWYFGIIERGTKEENEIWNRVAPMLCGANPKQGKSILYDALSPSNAQNPQDFIVLCYPSIAEEYIRTDAKLMSEELKYRVWYDEALEGITGWHEQVFRNRILHRNCHRAIIYVHEDMYSKNKDKISNDEIDGLYHEIKAIYEHNKSDSNRKIEYLVVLIGEHSNDIERFKNNLFWNMYQENKKKYEILNEVLFESSSNEGPKQDRLHAFRSKRASDCTHFSDSKNKYVATLKHWESCKEGE